MDNNNDDKSITMDIENMSEFFQWFFITSTAISKDGLTIEEFVNKVVEAGVRDDKGELTGNYRFQIFVNGIEVNPFAALSELQNQYETVVNQKALTIAENIVTEKFNDVNQALDNIKDHVEQKFNNLKEL